MNAGWALAGRTCLAERTSALVLLFLTLWPKEDEAPVVPHHPSSTACPPQLFLQDSDKEDKIC